MNATFVKDIRTENTGGGVMNDYIELKNGKVILIYEEGIMLFDNLHDAKNEIDRSRGLIEFPEVYLPDLLPMENSTFVESIKTEKYHGFNCDLVELVDGKVLRIADDVCALFKSYASAEEGKNVVGTILFDKVLRMI